MPCVRKELWCFICASMATLRRLPAPSCSGRQEIPRLTCRFYACGAQSAAWSSHAGSPRFQGRGVTRGISEILPGCSGRFLTDPSTLPPTANPGTMSGMSRPTQRSVPCSTGGCGRVRFQQINPCLCAPRTRAGSLLSCVQRRRAGEVQSQASPIGEDDVGCGEAVET